LEIHKDCSRLDYGPCGKLHQTVEFIKDIPQWHDEWFPIANNGISDEFEGM